MGIQTTNYQPPAGFRQVRLSLTALPRPAAPYNIYLLDYTTMAHISAVSCTSQGHIIFIPHIYPAMQSLWI